MCTCELEKNCYKQVYVNFLFMCKWWNSALLSVEQTYCLCLWDYLWTWAFVCCCSEADFLLLFFFFENCLQIKVKISIGCFCLALKIHHKCLPVIMQWDGNSLRVNSFDLHHRNPNYLIIILFIYLQTFLYFLLV